MALSQANCSKNQKHEDLIAAVQAVIKDAAQGRALKGPCVFWRRMQSWLAMNISTDTEALIELRR
jgi:hypothetical protein